MASYKQKLKNAQESERLLLELLAVIHRDGGQHTAVVGIARSAEEATQKVHQLRQALSEGRDATEM